MDNVYEVYEISDEKVKSIAEFLMTNYGVREGTTSWTEEIAIEDSKTHTTKRVEAGDIVSEPTLAVVRTAATIDEGSIAQLDGEYWISPSGEYHDASPGRHKDLGNELVFGKNTVVYKWIENAVTFDEIPDRERTKYKDEIAFAKETANLGGDPRHQTGYDYLLKKGWIRSVNDYFEVWDITDAKLKQMAEFLMIQYGVRSDNVNVTIGIESSRRGHHEYYTVGAGDFVSDPTITALRRQPKYAYERKMSMTCGFPGQLPMTGVFEDPDRMDESERKWAKQAHDELTKAIKGGASDEEVEKLVDKLALDYIKGDVGSKDHEEIKDGVLTRERAVAYGALGPTARASGYDIDVRRDHPHAAYGLVEWDVVTRPNGDVFDKAVVRILEMFESLRIIEQCVRQLKTVRGPVDSNPPCIPPGEGIGHYEAPRREVFHYIRSDDGNRPVRHKVSAPSYMNVPTNRETVVGSTIADATLILAAVDPCYCCTERMAVALASPGGERLWGAQELIRMSQEKTWRLMEESGWRGPAPPEFLT